MQHDGTHYVVDDVAFLPRPPRGRIPVWCAAMPGSTRPLRRAARHDGCVLANVSHPDEVAEALAVVRAHRDEAAGAFEVAVAVPADADAAAYERAGATWLLTDMAAEDVSADAVRALAATSPV